MPTEPFESGALERLDSLRVGVRRPCLLVRPAGVRRSIFRFVEEANLGARAWT